MDERIITNERLVEDHEELCLRPQSISEYIGQSEMKENLIVYINAAQMRD